MHESEKVKGKSLSRVRLLATPWTAAHQAPPSMGFSRHECRSGCHCLLHFGPLPGINPRPLQWNYEILTIDHQAIPWVIFWIPHTSDIIWFLSFLFWLTSLSMIITSLSMLLQMALFFIFYSWVVSHCVDKEMATHSSTLAWRIPGMEEPGGLPSMGLHRVRHNWSDLSSSSSSIPLYICSTSFHSFIYWWTCTLFPCLSHCE